MDKKLVKALRKNEIKDAFWSNLVCEEFKDEATGENRMRVRGIVQEADTVNQNRRIYPRAVMQEAIDNILPKCAERRVFGEVDHPFFSGSLKDTSHLVTNLWWNTENDRQLMGEMLVLNTPTGLVLKEILRAGGRPGFSSRGHGDAKEIEVDGVGKVTQISPGFRFESFDFVMDPSVKVAQITNVIEQLELSGAHTDEESDDMENEKKVETPNEKPEEETKELPVEKPEDKEGGEKEVETKTGPGIVEDEESGGEDEDGAEDEGEDKEDESLNKAADTLSEMVALLKEKGYISEVDATVSAEVSILKEKVTSLETELTETKGKLEAATKELNELKEAATKAIIETYISNKVKGNKFEAILKKRLTDANYKTKEEVDAALGGYAEFIEALNGQEDTFGKGRGKKTDEQKDKSGSSTLRDSIKQKAGIRPKEAK